MVGSNSLEYTGEPSKIFSGSKFIGITSKNKYLTWKEKPGEIKLRAVYLMNPGNPPTPNEVSEITVNGTAGESIYLLQGVEPIKIQKISNAKGEQMKQGFSATPIDIESGKKCEQLYKLELGMSITEVESIIGKIHLETRVTKAQQDKVTKKWKVQERRGHYTSGKLALELEQAIYENLLTFKNGRLRYLYSDPCMLIRSNLSTTESEEMIFNPKDEYSLTMPISNTYSRN